MEKADNQERSSQGEASGPRRTESDPSLVLTIGHSNRPIEDFIDLLWSNEVARVLDVRTVPRSRHNPQFNIDALPATLEKVAISYTHLAGLGGLRRSQADSSNTGWRNLSFRGYADYMQSAEFAENVDRVVEMARRERCVLMCAEAVPWRCHRSLIGDALLVRGVRVEDIMGPKSRRPHVLTRFARVEGSRITYPPEDGAGEVAEERKGGGKGEGKSEEKGEEKGEGKGKSERKEKSKGKGKDEGKG